MNYYGKQKEDFTSEERKLFTKDLALMASTDLNRKGKIIDVKGVSFGDEEVTFNIYLDRYAQVAVILGIKRPETDDEMTELIEKAETTPYSLRQFSIDFHRQKFELVKDIILSHMFGERMGQMVMGRMN